MKNRKLILVAVVAALVVLLTSCSLDPRGLSLPLKSYTCNGLTYSKDMNRYSLFEQFSADDVTLSIDKDGNLTLTIFDEVKQGALDIDSIKKKNGDSTWTFTMDDGTSGNGESYFSPLRGHFCTIEYLGETYSFFEPENPKDARTNETNYIDYYVEHIKEHFVDKDTYGYYSIFTEGKIILKGSHYYFVDEATETQTRLALDAGFFYQYESETLAVSETIRSGACLLYGEIAADSPYMIFYID